MSRLSTTPSRRRWGRTAAIGTVAVLVLAGGCGNKAATSGGPVKFDIGVTDTTITLGVLTDRTGTYAKQGVAIGAARDLYWKDRKVCNRTVEFIQKDHRNLVAEVVSAYPEIKDKVLALDELLGPAQIESLLPDLQKDRMTTLAASWDSALLKNPSVVVVGSTYDIEVINGIDYLLTSKVLAKGDKVGVIYADNAYGANTLRGARFSATANNLTLVEQKVIPTANDLAPAITALKAAGTKVVVLATTPTQTASAVGLAGAQAMDATFLGVTPSYTGALLGTAAKGAVEKNLLISTAITPYNSDLPAIKDFRDKLKAADVAATPPGTAASSLYVNFSTYGYAQQQVMYQILDAACRMKDLTRAGVQKAWASLKSLDTNGVVPVLDYSVPGQIPTRQTSIVKPDATVEGTLVQVQGLTTSDLAKTYQP